MQSEKIIENISEDELQNEFNKSLIKDLSMDLWYDNVMALVLFVKNNGKNTTILKEANFKDFLSKLNSKLPIEDLFRCQVALYSRGGHWCALDILLRNKLISIIYMDSVKNTTGNSLSSRLIEMIESEIKYPYHIFDLSLNQQKDGSSCSRYTINFLSTAKKADAIHEDLSKLNDKNLTIFSVDMTNMPLSLINILRFYQYTEEIDNIPQRLTEAILRKSKHFEKNESPLTLQSFFNNNINDKKNNFIDHKKQRYIKNVVELINENKIPLINVLNIMKNYEFLNQMQTLSTNKNEKNKKRKK